MLNAALANCGKSSHSIHEIPYYLNEKQNEQKTEQIAITPRFEEEEEYDAFPDYQEMEENLDKNVKYKHKFDKIAIKNNCNFCDIVGIIDWKQCNVERFLANKKFLIAAESLLSTHYPHLINRLYHINMPLNFEKIENVIKKEVSSQILQKSIFLESEHTKQRRMEYMKKNRKTSIKRNRSSRKYK